MPETETPASQPAAADKRRAILDAAIRVFARQGYHATRVADIADEAGVAYGLVYHYFRSKEAVMTELFTERWSLLLDAGEQVKEPATVVNTRGKQLQLVITLTPDLDAHHKPVGFMAFFTSASVVSLAAR